MELHVQFTLKTFIIKKGYRIMIKKINILIIEDEILIAMMIKNNLELNGFNVCNILPSGEEAINIAINKNPDIILMDIKLAGEMDGFDTAKYILKKINIPIVYMTGYSIKEYEEKIKELKPITYINKPVNIEKLINIINGIIN